jgi:hypothetical protein
MYGEHNSREVEMIASMQRERQAQMRAEAWTAKQLNAAHHPTKVKLRRRLALSLAAGVMLVIAFAQGVG